MQFWKAHPALRVALIALCFLGGLALVAYGWTITGKPLGLFLMLAGLALLLAALLLYNKPFEPRAQKRQSFPE